MRNGRAKRPVGWRNVLISEPLESRCLLSTLPPGFSESLLAGNLQSPSAMAVAPDGRVFIAEQGGTVKVVKDGALLPSPLLTVSTNSDGERGLLGITVDPSFDDNGYVYVFYAVDGTEIHNRISRFTVVGDAVVAGSEQALLDMPATINRFHMGGALAFGPDGMLYIASGENTGKANAQDLTNLKGKILRIAPDGAIPTDNPFYDTLTGDNRAIWAYGFRNPYTMNFQPSTGRLFINDVGDKSFEEINEGVAGGNFGWADNEGPTTDPELESPIYAYPGESAGIEVCIIGGAFYEGVAQQFPAQYSGQYFFADYVQGWIHTIDPETLQVNDFATGVSFPTGMAVGPDGTIYYLARGAESGGQPQTGGLYQIEYSVSQPPVITTSPADVFVASGQPATFFASASGEPPLAYQWQRNGVDIVGATSQTYTIPSTALSDNGATFRMRVTNAHGSTTSAPADLTVTANKPPTVQILAPASGTTFVGGQAFSFAGSGADPETGTLAASALTWSIDFHHDDHAHPFMATRGISVGSFTASTTGETDPDVFYRIHLTVTDPVGLTATTFRDITPVKSSLTLQANPPGVQVKLDGQGQDPAVPAVGVAMIERTLEAPATRIIDGVPYVFDRWSDGNTNSTRDFSFPSQNTTLIAQYRPFVAEGPAVQPGAGTIYEAESAKLKGATKVRLKARHTGDGFVALSTADQEITWPINASKAGNYSLVLRYAHGEKDALPVAFSVNGNLAANATLKSTANWNTWKTVNVRVQLPAGTSDVRLDLNATGTLYVDSVRVGKAISEAELATVDGGVVVSNPPTPSASGFVQLRTKGKASPAVAVEWTVEAAIGGTHDVYLLYANGSAEMRTVEVIDVNSGAKATIALPPTGSWSTWQYATGSIPLAAGSHKLRLTTAVASTVVIDSLTLSPPVG
jgi:glucose/arabinose dehydrogenase